MSELFLSDIVEKYVTRSGWKDREIARRCGEKRFKDAIGRWRKEVTRKPRYWEDLLIFAKALSLVEDEANELLIAAGHDPIEQLRLQTLSERQTQLLEFWDKERGDIFQAPQMDVQRFIGRKSERETTRQALRTGRQLCAIIGFGGLGKTTLAIHAANQLHVHFPDGVLWARVDNLMDVLHAFAAAFDRDVSAESSLEARGSVVRGLLASKRVLIVLDNIESGDQLDVLLPKTGRCAVLITTRNRQVAANRPFVTVDLSPFDQAESVELLESYLGEQRLRDEEAAMAQLSLFVDGLPLALRVIGATLAEVETLSLSEYVQELSAETSRLDHLADWTDASKNVRASFEVSYQRVPSAAQRVFRALAGLGNGDFSADAVAHIAELSLPQTKLWLGRLTAFSLVQKANDHVATPRFQLHPLLKTFAIEKAGNQLSKFQQSATTYFLNYLKTNQVEPAYSNLDNEWSHIADTLERLNAAERHSDLCSAMLALTTLHLGTIGYLDRRGRWQFAIRHLMQAARQPEGSVLDNASLVLRQGAFSFRLAQYAQCKTHLARYHTLTANLPHTAERIMLDTHWHEFSARLNTQQQEDAETALGVLDEGIVALTQLEGGVAQQQQGYLQIVKGEVLARRLGMFQEAITIIETGIAKLPQQPTSAELSALNALSALYPQLGDLAASNHCCERGAALADALGDQRRRANFMMNRAINAQKTGEISHAEQLLQDALTIYQRIGDVNEEGSVWVNMGMIRVIQGNHAAALDVLRTAQMLGEQHAILELTAYALLTMIRPNLAQDDLAAAHANLDKASQLCREYKLISLLPLCLIYGGWLAHLAGQSTQAVEQVRDGYQIAIQNGALQDAGFAQSLYAQLLDRTERTDEARLAHKEALTLLQGQDIYELALAQRAYLAHLRQQKGALNAAQKAVAQTLQTIFLQLGSPIVVRVDGAESDEM